MCETFSFKIKRFNDRSKIALKGQFYVIMIGVEVDIKMHPKNDNNIFLHN